jgi:hypothetical protein
VTDLAPLTIAPENAQFLETRRFLREEICGLYGVPLQRIQAIVENASQGGGKGIDAIDARLRQARSADGARASSSAWDRMLPAASGRSRCSTMTTSCVPAPRCARRSHSSTAHRGIRTPDEIRGKDYGLPPLPDGEAPTRSPRSTPTPRPRAAPTTRRATAAREAS